MGKILIPFRLSILVVECSSLLISLYFYFTLSHRRFGQGYLFIYELDKQFRGLTRVFGPEIEK